MVKIIKILPKQRKQIQLQTSSRDWFQGVFKSEVGWTRGHQLAVASMIHIAKLASSGN
jgi:hypothetical protein